MSFISESASAFKSRDDEEYSDNVIYLEAVRSFASVFPKLPPDEQRRILHLHRRPLVALTILTNEKGLAAKIFTLNSAGELEKTSAAQIYKGTFHRIKVRGVAGLLAEIEDFDSNQATTYGTPKIEADTGKIATQRSLNGSGDTIARDREHFAFAEGEPGVLMLDYDPRKGHKPLSRQELDAILCEVMPELGRVERAWRPSASAFIYRKSDGAELIGSGGWRCYTIVDDASAIPTIGALLYQRLWEAGHGFIQLSKSGALLDRSLVDASVWQPERLDFAAAPKLAEGLERRASEGVILPGVAMLATAGLAADVKPLDAWRSTSRVLQKKRDEIKPKAEKAQKRFAKERVEKLKEEGINVDAAVIERAAKEQILAREFIVHTADGRAITVGELLDHRKKWHGKRFCDPLEPGYANDRRIAVAYTDQDTPIIWSFAHGGVKYTLQDARVKQELREEEPREEDFEPEPRATEDERESGRQKGTTDRTKAKDARARTKTKPSAIKEDGGALWPSEKPRKVWRYADSIKGIAVISKDKEDVEKLTPITNFAARIVGQISFDDGAEVERRFEIEAYLAGRYFRFMISTSELARSIDWTLREIGAKAIISAGKVGGIGCGSYLREAIQQLSPLTVPQRTIYAHTGWRKIEEQVVYLHAGGGIGAAGAVEGIETDLSGQGLALALLPDPPQGEELKAAIRSSLSLLDLGPLHVTAPLYASIWRATLGGADFSVFEVGKTQVFKTQIAALAQQHWGAGFVATKLPATWQSTGNSLEVQAYGAKDMLLVVDDFAPSGSQTEISRQHKEAARILRSQGNLSGRARLRADASQRPVKAPRGLILATGEDLPHGQSVRGRTFVIEVRAGDIASAALTLAQEAGSRGDYALAMSGWLRHLAATPAVWEGFRAERKKLRIETKGEHARTDWMVADLLAALKTFLVFAVEAGAIDDAEALARLADCTAGILAGTGEQSVHMQTQDPAERFICLISAALVTGRAHLASTGDGASAPIAHKVEWGWSVENHWMNGARSTVMKPAGSLIGWTDEDARNVWLDPSAAYNLAQKMAIEQSMPLPVEPNTLWKRLKEAGKLAKFTTEKRNGKEIERSTHKKGINGSTRWCVALPAASLKSPAPKMDEED